jgi:hypothetical protein
VAHLETRFVPLGGHTAHLGNHCTTLHSGMFNIQHEVFHHTANLSLLSFC